MVAYEIEVRPAALRALRRIDRKDQARIRGAVALLATNPRPPGAIALKGRSGLRVRAGNYRIIYLIEDGKLLIVVVAITDERSTEIIEMCRSSVRKSKVLNRSWR